MYSKSIYSNVRVVFIFTCKTRQERYSKLFSYCHFSRAKIHGRKLFSQECAWFKPSGKILLSKLLQKKMLSKKQIAVTTSAFCSLVHNFAHCCNATFLKSPRQVLLVINDLGFFKNRFSQKKCIEAENKSSRSPFFHFLLDVSINQVQISHFF